MNWLIENWGLIVIVLGSIVVTGSAIAKLTATDKDDKFWTQVGELLKKLPGAKR